LQVSDRAALASDGVALALWLSATSSKVNRLLSVQRIGYDGRI
jgi:hypothetical protein